MLFRTLFLLLLTAALAACRKESALTALPRDVPTATLAPSTATPNLTPTAAPTATRTPAPTVFVSPPSAGQAAAVPILMYHHLKDLPPQSSRLLLDWTVAPAAFETQMSQLAERGYHPITVAQLSAHLTRSQPLPAKPIVISFDDGWEEGFTVAFPILKKYHFVGAFFVYTNPLDRPKYLTWSQLQEMSAAGMEINSHSLSHPHLRTLEREAAIKEIGESKSLLEKRLGKRVTAFAYPFGEYNQDIIDLVKKAGYESAVTIASGYNQRADAVYQLRRTRISYGDTFSSLKTPLP